MRLRQAIAAEHQAIEQTPVAAATVSGRVGLESYTILLAELWHVHAWFEASLPPDVPFDPVPVTRSTAIAADLVALGGCPTADPGPAARQLIRTFQQWGAEPSPAKLLGAAYVFEGSRMGSMVLAPRLARALGVPAEPGRGLDYHLDGIDGRPAHWQQFRAALDAVPLTAAEQEQAVAAAVETMAGLRAVYAAVPVPAGEPVVA